MCFKYVATHTHKMCLENVLLNASNSNTCSPLMLHMRKKTYNVHFTVQPLTINGPDTHHQVTLQDFSPVCAFPNGFWSSLTKSPRSGADWCTLLRTAVGVCDLIKKPIQKLRDSLTVCHMLGIWHTRQTIINIRIHTQCFSMCNSRSLINHNMSRQRFNTLHDF